MHKANYTANGCLYLAATLFVLFVIFFICKLDVQSAQTELSTWNIIREVQKLDA